MLATTLVGWELLVCCWAYPGLTGAYPDSQGSPVAVQLIVSVSPRFLFIKVFIIIYSFVLDDSFKK